MPGALIDLIATGIQDQPMIANPEMTFWKSEFKPYSNFAIESMEQIFTGQVDYGRKCSAIISRSGDLVWNVYLQVATPEINQSQGANGTGPVYARWLDYPGEQILAETDIEVGGNRIDRYYGDWAHIWNQLTMPVGKQKHYLKMIGHTTQLTYLTDPNFAPVQGPCSASATPNTVCAPRQALPETTLYIPLLFWFCTSPGLALPLIALQFHEVKINVCLRPLGECLWAVNSLAHTSGNQLCQGCYTQSLVAASLYIDYVFLDVEERKSFVANPHSYLITQLQYPGDESIGTASVRCKVNMSHPMKELIWVVQPDVNVDYCSSFIAGTTLFNVLGAQPFNYTDAIDALPNAIHAFAGPNAIDGSNQFINASGLFTLPGGEDYASTALGMYLFNGDPASASYAPFEINQGAGGTDYGSLLSDPGVFVLAETAMHLDCSGENPVITAKLQLNGQDRFSEREGSYFDVVQNFQFHTNSNPTGINTYSFSISPESDQPAGALNFSRIDTANLNMIISAAAIGGSATAKVRIYGRNINFFRVVGGMGGSSFSS